MIQFRASETFCASSDGQINILVSTLALGGAACTQGVGNPRLVQEAGAAHGVGGYPCTEGGGNLESKGGAAQRYCTIWGNPPFVCTPEGGWDMARMGFPDFQNC